MAKAKAKTASKVKIPQPKAGSKAKASAAKRASKPASTTASKALKAPPVKKTTEQRRAEKQTLAMWALLGNGGEGLASKLKPRIDKAEREALRAAGLISVPEKRGANIVVTDRGWHWANDHLSDPLPDGNSGAVVLQAWLARIHAFMKANELTLADMLEKPSRRFTTRNKEPMEPAASPAQPDYATLRERIRKAYLDVTAGQWNTRALLRNVRSAFADTDRHALDNALLRMQREEQASLMRLDNQFEITDADRDAALFIGNEPRHILWISR